MRRLAVAAAQVAAAAGPVLITGETGTGKELLAHEIHRQSARARQPLVTLSCATLPEPLVESELFGHRQGAYPGALRSRRGLLEEAHGGTVLLDEVGELSPGAQVRLLRALETGEILPFGAQRTIPVDVRILAATQRDLAADAKAGRFRPDLLYRLSVFRLWIPPLRERREDIPLLIQCFMAGSAEARRKRLRGITQAALAALLQHDYPGNIRELRHALELSCILADEGGAIDLGHLPEEITRPAVSAAPTFEDDCSLKEAARRFERAFIVRALEREGWDRARAARRLGVPLRVLLEKMQRHGIEEPGQTI